MPTLLRAHRGFGSPKPLVVVSAVAAVSGGPFTILEHAVAAARRCDQANFLFLVHDPSLWTQTTNVRFIGLPWANRSYPRRIWAEYALLPLLSRGWHPDAWLSLHDTTAPVRARRQAVYCHNPLPYWRPTLRDVRFHWFEVVRSFLYGPMMRKFVHRNDLVVGQLPWYTEFIGRYLRVPPDRLVVVAPTSPAALADDASGRSVIGAAPHDVLECLYVALPRVFKNFEEAIDVCDQPGVRLTLTLSGDENDYARHVREYARTRGRVRFVGALAHADALATTGHADVVLFPSRLETYGLPIHEAIARDRTVVLPVRPWTVEVAGEYERAHFYRSRAEARDIVAALARGETPETERPTAPRSDLRRLSGFEDLYESLLG